MLFYTRLTNTQRLYNADIYRQIFHLSSSILLQIDQNSQYPEKPVANKKVLVLRNLSILSDNNLTHYRFLIRIFQGI